MSNAKMPQVLPATISMAVGVPEDKGVFVIAQLDCKALLDHPVRLLLDPATNCLVFVAHCGCTVQLDVATALLRLAGHVLHAHPAPASGMH